MEMKNEIGLNIKRNRLSRNLSQEQLAEKVYSTKSTISKWEKGDIVPSVEVLKIVAKALGVSLHQILGEKTPFMARFFNFLGKFILWGLAWCHIDVTFVGVAGGIAVGFAVAGPLIGLGAAITSIVATTMVDAWSIWKVLVVVGYILWIPLFFLIFEAVAFILYVPARQVHMFSRKHFWRMRKYNFKLTEFEFVKRIKKPVWITLGVACAIGTIYLAVVMSLIATQTDAGHVWGMEFHK